MRFEVLEINGDSCRRLELIRPLATSTGIGIGIGIGIALPSSGRLRRISGATAADVSEGSH
jgi:hypothetical protein